MTINWSYFTLQIFCILLLHTFFLIIILKKKKGKRLFHVIKIQTKITWSILNIYIFSDIKESSRGWAMNIKTFWHSSPYSSLAMMVGRWTFVCSHHVYLRRRRWAMEFINVVGTKHNAFLTFIFFARASVMFFVGYSWSIISIVEYNTRLGLTNYSV